MSIDFNGIPQELHSEALFSFIHQHSGSLIGIGCDILEISRFRAAHSRIGAPFLLKIFTYTELQIIEKMADPIPSLAVRFSAKEALSKALGTGIGAKLNWHDMEIMKEKEGKPYVTWNESIKEEFAIERTYLSLSHSDTYAIAFCALAAAR